MTLTGFNRPVPQIVVRVRAHGMSRLRRAYFSLASESASRYRMAFDRVTQHLWRARRSNLRFTVRCVKFPDDLIHAIACVDGIGLAWVDLAERYEPTLIRQCRSTHDEVSSVMLVRQLFVDLRRLNRAASDGALPSMRNYTGDRPLSAWLAERLNALRMREALARVHQRPMHARATGASPMKSKVDRHNVLLGEQTLPLPLAMPFQTDERDTASTPVRAVASADG